MKMNSSNKWKKNSVYVVDVEEKAGTRQCV